MAFRFRTSIRLAKGLRVNLGTSGISTTLGGRGLSMNVGKRGTRVTASLPGTGISYSARAGGGGRGASGGASGAGTEAAGCMGCGAAGVFLLLFMGFCASLGDPPKPDYATAADTTAIAPMMSSYTAPEVRETFYLHEPMNVRSGAGKDFGLVRTVARGERVSLGAKDAGGWAPVFDDYGNRIGYLYRASDNVRAYAPRPEPPRRKAAPSHPAGASAICRDGTYSYSRSRRGTCSWHGGVATWL
jgi:Protein of unknown function (DUF4236)/Protein of unknown function (DUF3761)